MNRKTSTLTSLGVSVALIAAGIWFLYNHHRYFGYGDGNWIMPHHMMMTRGGGMGLIMILFWVVAVTAIILLASSLITWRRSSEETGSNKTPGALEILKKRYASGEIDQSQYESMRRDLQ